MTEESLPIEVDRTKRIASAEHLSRRVEIHDQIDGVYRARREAFVGALAGDRRFA